MSVETVPSGPAVLFQVILLHEIMRATIVLRACAMPFFVSFQLFVPCRVYRSKSPRRWKEPSSAACHNQASQFIDRIFRKDRETGLFLLCLLLFRSWCPISWPRRHVQSDRISNFMVEIWPSFQLSFDESNAEEISADQSAVCCTNHRDKIRFSLFTAIALQARQAEKQVVHVKEHLWSPLRSSGKQFRDNMYACR